MPAIDPAALLRAVPFFASLSREDSERLAERAKVVEVAAGERILREGEVGDRMFVVQTGSVQIFTTSFDQSNLVLVRLEAGECFGEQALLPGGTGRRTASVRALEDCTLLELSREAIVTALSENGEMLSRMRVARDEQHMARNDKLRAGVFAKLGVVPQSESCRLESFRAGETVFREGDRGERVYLLLKGRALVKHTGNGADEVLAELMPGQFFGELAILNDSPRAATIEAAEEIDVAADLVQTEPGKRPQWREIPQRLVLEVPITHPDFPWFPDLGLKWYAVPAVSSMLFDAAGVLYSAAPFNGWYMGTEIGARNFGDSYRYNLLPVVGQKMGLDMSSDRTLWRDRVLVELNIAVLSSYEKAGVTMMDHHAASHSFDKFEQFENAAGRTVHARWNWIVPPISGSAVTIFHRDYWKDIQLKPCYTHQSDPWKDDFSWKSEAG